MTKILYLKWRMNKTEKACFHKMDDRWTVTKHFHATWNTSSRDSIRCQIPCFSDIGLTLFPRVQVKSGEICWLASPTSHFPESGRSVVKTLQVSDGAEPGDWDNVWWTLKRPCLSQLAYGTEQREAAASVTERAGRTAATQKLWSDADSTSTYDDLICPAAIPVMLTLTHKVTQMRLKNQASSSFIRVKTFKIKPKAFSMPVTKGTYMKITYQSKGLILWSEQQKHLKRTLATTYALLLLLLLMTLSLHSIVWYILILIR